MKQSLLHFFRLFSDDASCRRSLEQRLWKATPTCPHCKNSQKVYGYKNGRTLKCAGCGSQFQVTTGTIYKNPNVPRQKWFLTLYLTALSKKGISSIELAKAIGVTQKTAWCLLHKVRYMVEHQQSDHPLAGDVVVVQDNLALRKPIQNVPDNGFIDVFLLVLG